jgi:hypothetical protein
MYEWIMELTMIDFSREYWDDEVGTSSPLSDWIAHWIVQLIYAPWTGIALTAFVLVSCSVGLYDAYKGTAPPSYAQNPRWLMGALALAGIISSVWMLFWLLTA